MVKSCRPEVINTCEFSQFIGVPLAGLIPLVSRPESGCAAPNNRPGQCCLAPPLLALLAEFGENIP